MNAPSARDGRDIGIIKQVRLIANKGLITRTGRRYRPAHGGFGRGFGRSASVS